MTADRAVDRSAPGSADVSGIRLAIVNWRDPWHPAAGGAERYAWEIARRFAARGADVTYVTSRFPSGGAGGPPQGRRVDGVQFVRAGGRFTVYPRVLLGLLARRHRFDAVIDCQNGIPFFTPWVLPRRVPVFCVIHHVHDQQFGLYFPAWLAWVGRTLEGPVTRWTYRRQACVVVSLSTRQAVRERLRWRGPAYVVPNGVSTSPALEATTSPGGGPEIVCVTRLVPHKRVERVVALAERLRDRWPGLRVHIVGDGPDAGALAERIARLGVGGLVVQHGYVSEEHKAALVGRATLHLSTSRGEGWGLSVLEAAAHGVPTVSYDVEGLRDAVRDGATGWLVPEPAMSRLEPAMSRSGPAGEPVARHDAAAAEERAVDALADVVQRALKELDDPVRRAEVARACREWAGEFDWSRTADRMASLVAAAVRAGSAATADDDAHVVHGYGDERPGVVEGPARDELLRHGDPAAAPRVATPLERLLGRALDGDPPER